jgi:hypothetical protein
MAQFIETTQLPATLRDIIREAKRELFLVSPFFKLEGEYIKMLETVSREKPKLQIKVLFGKNETNKQRSLSDSDLAIMKGWSNVDIRYADNLHAKFYANESKALVTSLNFHAFSLGNNIESGVLLEKSLTEMVTKNKPFEEAYKYFQSTFEASEQVFFKVTKKAPRLSFGFKSDSINISDNTEQVFAKNEKVKVPSSSKSSFWDKQIEPIGYCIRTGIQIPFNPEMPFCEKAFASWNRYKDPAYPEKYCHYSGEAGETSMEKPILRKNWALAKKHLDATK